MLQASFVALCVGFAVVSLLSLTFSLTSISVMANYYDGEKKPNEQTKETKSAWRWAKIWVILFLLAVILSVYCGVFATKV